MCTLALFWRDFPSTPLVIAANRDENPQRPWSDPHWWDGIFAGRDEVAGGTSQLLMSGSIRNVSPVVSLDGATPTQVAQIAEFADGALVTRAVAQAIEYGHPVEREVAFLIVHGVLHLLGYDHERPADAARMRPREEAILATLGLPR